MSTLCFLLIIINLSGSFDIDICSNQNITCRFLAPYGTNDPTSGNDCTNHDSGNSNDNQPDDHPDGKGGGKGRRRLSINTC